jgi:hypothetical protein
MAALEWAPERRRIRPAGEPGRGSTPGKHRLVNNLQLHAANSGLCSCMDWQQLISLIIVAGAVGLLVRSKFRRPAFSLQKDTHCGCAPVAGSERRSSITFRARKGQRPEIIVKQK